MFDIVYVQYKHIMFAKSRLSGNTTKKICGYIIHKVIR